MSKHHASRVAAFVVVSLLFVSVRAEADPVACRTAIVKATAGFVKAKTKALQKCEAAKRAGKLDAATVCTAEEKAAGLILKSKTKLTTTIAKACGGSDKICGGATSANDDPLSAIGWDIGNCPNFENLDCDIAIASCADISSCIACIGDVAIEQAVGFYYGTLAPIDGGLGDSEEKALAKCQNSIGKAASKYLRARSKALSKCWDRVIEAGAGSCPDDATTEAFAKAEARKVGKILKACARSEGTADDFTVAQIGFGASCPDVTPPGAASCGGGLSTLDDLIACVDCLSDFKADCIDRATVPANVQPYPAECNQGAFQQCAAQRAVHIVGGNGGLSWFTLIWPLPQVISGFQANYAYDDPSKAAAVAGTDPEHPLYARKIGDNPVWQGVGSWVEPSAFVAGTNQTHTSSPTTTTVNGTEMLAAGAALQGSLGAPVPALRFAGANYGPAPGAPSPVSVTTIDEAISAINGVTPVTPEMESELRASEAELATWGVTVASAAAIRTLAERLYFTAKAFRLNLISTVTMPAFNDDPHGAFTNVPAVTERADQLARILDSFYADMDATAESACSLGGQQVSLADNVVLVVSGDTPKNSYERTGWSDGTAGNANLVYVRSNGFLDPGWFGNVSPSTRTNFDAETGFLDPTATVSESTTAAQLGILYAISRGNAAAVSAVSSAPYQGVLRD